MRLFLSFVICLLVIYILLIVGFQEGHEQWFISGAGAQVNLVLPKLVSGQGHIQTVVNQSQVSLPFLEMMATLGATVKLCALLIR